MKERFARKISELKYCLGEYQPNRVLGEPGTVEIEASYWNGTFSLIFFMR